MEEHNASSADQPSSPPGSAEHSDAPKEDRPTAPILAILGGYGLLGQAMARRLLTGSDARVVVVGRSQDRARELADGLAEEHGADRVEARRADAAKPDEVAEAARGADWLVIALDGAELLEPVIEGALAAKVHCLDLLIDAGRTEVWAKHRGRFVEAGRTVITEAGVLPGLPGVLLRAVAEHRPTANKIDVATSIRPAIQRDQPMPASMVSLMKMFVTRPRYYAFGHPALDLWGFVSPYRFFWFHAPFRRQTVTLMGLPEVEAFAARHPKIQKIRNLVGGLNTFAMWVALPILYPFLVLSGRRSMGFFAKLFYYGALRPFRQAPPGVAVRAEVKGHGGGRASFEIHHEEEYGLTAAVVSALVRSVGSDPPAPGVHHMADVVEAETFLTDLESLGARLFRASEPTASAPSKEPSPAS